MVLYLLPLSHHLPLICSKLLKTKALVALDCLIIPPKFPFLDLWTQVTHALFQCSHYRKLHLPSMLMPSPIISYVHLPCPWSLSFHIIPWSSFAWFFYTVFYFGDSGACFLALLPNSSNHPCSFLSLSLVNWNLYTSNWLHSTELSIKSRTLMPPQVHAW